MNYYGYSGKKSKYNGNKRRIIINIIVIVITIAGSVTFALLLGNYLKNKMDNAPISTEPIEQIIPDTGSDDQNEDEPYQKGDFTYEQLAMIGGYLDIGGCPSAEAAEKFVLGLKGAGYTGAVFELKDESGHFTVPSDSVTSLTGAVTEGSITTKELLSSALESCKKNGMRTSAYMRLSDIYTSDEAGKIKSSVEKEFICEMCRAGFDEIIFDGAISKDDFDSSRASALYSYVSSIREKCPGTAFGLVLDSDIFENPELTPTLELINRYMDFFCVDFRDRAVFTDEKTDAFLSNYSGSFTAYRIRALLPGGNIDVIRSGYEKFISNGRSNISFLEVKSDFEPAYSEEDGSFDYSCKVPSYTITKPDDDLNG